MDKIIAPAQSLAFSASYIAVLIVLGIALTWRVVMVRHAAQVSLGDGQNPELLKRIRAHGNFAEHAPWIALPLLVLPFIGASEIFIHIIGATGVTGRILHAIAVSKGNAMLRFRAAGMIMTFAAQGLGALFLLFFAWR